jgi:CheY-like chemotaxis protein
MIPASPRVLVVDDDQHVARSLVMLLQSLGAEVCAVYGGAAALEKVAVFKPHLVFLDICMPAVDGFETARRIRMLPEGKDLVLALLSATSWADDPRRVAEARFDHYFVKPIPIDALENLLASTPVSP